MFSILSLLDYGKSGRSDNYWHINILNRYIDTPFKVKSITPKFSIDILDDSIYINTYNRLLAKLFRFEESDEPIDCPQCYYKIIHLPWHCDCYGRLKVVNGQWVMEDDTDIRDMGKIQMQIKHRNKPIQDIEVTFSAYGIQSAPTWLRFKWIKRLWSRVFKTNWKALDIKFSDAVGRDYDSWKGGTYSVSGIKIDDSLDTPNVASKKACIKYLMENWKRYEIQKLMD